MVGNSYHPNITKAKELGRPFDIVHKHIRFYDTNYNDFHIKLSVHAGEHKNVRIYANLSILFSKS